MERAVQCGSRPHFGTGNSRIVSRIGDLEQFWTKFPDAQATNGYKTYGFITTIADLDQFWTKFPNAQAANGYTAYGFITTIADIDQFWTKFPNAQAQWYTAYGFTTIADLNQFGPNSPMHNKWYTAYGFITGKILFNFGPNSPMHKPLNRYQHAYGFITTIGDLDQFWTKFTNCLSV
ncbi:hypothetical protein AVEN_197051-1 [Araneus ventricosus]|uniref:Uncharacterized protein n=1 Tax=Araneus ventricosus TaxID=182803 RepID=A0A4Y2HHL5_ARAVE|nr:hypothetical protein AVEN_197051-1 [Araneus ventricosus]